MQKQHHYKATVLWTGNLGTGTENYRSYERSYEIIIENKPNILGSSDPAFRGEKNKHNPEDFLITSLSSCHMLWYLHFCSDAGVGVIDYVDNATGIMVESSNGSGQFAEVILYPTVTVTEPTMVYKAIELHRKANEYCFIANSVNFPVKHNPTIIVK